jgi:hypothetical protein
MIRNCARALSLLVVLLVPVLLLVPGSSRADNDETVRFLTSIPVPGSATNTTGGKMYVYDISWLDPKTQRFYLADRSNAVIDVVDAKRGVFVKQISGGFKGFTGSNDTSGPNGVVVAFPWLFVTDAPSRVVSIDLRTDKVVDHVFTRVGDENRTDELAYDPEEGLLLVVNNADTPPFATLIEVDKETGKLTVGPQIEFADATNGAEQPVWDPHTGRFYLSIPEVNGPGDGSGPHGAVARINPITAEVETEFAVDFCQPAGLALGPHQDLLLGCATVFDTAGQAWSAKDSHTAAPQQVIMDAETGHITAHVAGVGGSDEVVFNSGDRRYYTASRVNPSGPVLGVIDAEREILRQVVPTLNVAAVPHVHPSGSAHSVAVDPTMVWVEIRLENKSRYIDRCP